MAGKIIADTLEHTTAGSLDTQYVVNGSAKFWININTTTFTVADSFNNSSNTDNGSGLAAFSFTSSMGNTGYNYNTNRNGSSNSTNGFIAESYAQTTSSISTSAKYIDTNSVNLGDAGAVSVSIRGDLA